jgi:hypothetical protein
MDESESRPFAREPTVPVFARRTQENNKYERGVLPTPLMHSITIKLIRRREITDEQTTIWVIILNIFLNSASHGNIRNRD